MSREPDTGQRIVVFTDGACLGNPGPGGWAAIPQIIEADGTLTAALPLTGGDPWTTNNRMELEAVIGALEAYPEGSIEVVSDSQYLIKGITEWMRPWKSRGWKNGKGQKVRNRDQWQQLDALTAGRPIRWTWVKGHNGHRGNEEADRLANEAAARFLSGAA